MRTAVTAILLALFTSHAAGADGALWLDTDASCNGRAYLDVDDCLALYHLLQSGRIPVGVSTVFGNATRSTADRAVAEILTVARTDQELVVPTWPGAMRPGDCKTNKAVRALAARLQNEQLTILALGPLTNIGCLVETYPRATANIESLIVVMGARAGHLFHPAEGARHKAFLGHGMMFSDLNFDKDRDAACLVLSSGIPLTLVPYETSRYFEITAVELEVLATTGAAGALIDGRSRGWLSLWRHLNGREGFYPFDLVAAMTVTEPERFGCVSELARIGADRTFRIPGGGPRRLMIGPVPWPDEGETRVVSVCAARHAPDVRRIDIEASFGRVRSGGL